MQNTWLFLQHILFPEFRIQQYKQQNSRVHNTIYAYMDTKGRMCRHLHSTNKTKYKMHLMNTMTVHGVIWWQVRATRRINRTSILSKERSRFSLVYTWSALKSWNQQDEGWDCSMVSITRFEKKYFLAFIELKGVHIICIGCRKLY